MNSVGPELPYHANQEWKIHYLNTNEIMSIAGHLEDVLLYSEFYKLILLAANVLFLPLTRRILRGWSGEIKIIPVRQKSLMILTRDFPQTELGNVSSFYI